MIPRCAVNCDGFTGMFGAVYDPTLIDHRRDGAGPGMRLEGDVNGRDAKEPPVGFITSKVRPVLSS